MKKLIAVSLFALMPGLAMSDDAVHANQAERTANNVKPVVSVVALSAENAEEFARLRSEYQAGKIKLSTEYEMRLDAILSQPVSASF